ncbi:CheY-like superfamily [Penicillium cf. griseofulvum]|uniref:histidine kinase n=1 Tax=Penicillium cf. griseofulvum TaxID=2972120 RepID=A0A9W9T6J3_9EURO|nr:CheY-like superfamily [Penicillium cf. griseofulvum]KAJ5422536.1 CheY-like superfamily [Penicillium cf. griseofulvum]
MDYKADRQTREVYRYFQPENPAVLNAILVESEHVGSIADFSRVTTPFLPNASDPGTGYVEDSSLSSPNTTLTSFAQLAALRLNAQRAFITVLNTDSQFILAEATRNTNLKSSKSSEGEGDRLFAGTSTLSNAWNICQETVAIGPDNENGLYSFMVVNDLQQEERFRELPFVTHEPHSRFYAATPLTSDSGINLGCLFVLDPEPRQGLSDTEKDTLGKVAELVMDYLLVSRQAAEGRRASRLSRGLHLFVDGNSSFPSNARMSSRSSSSAQSTSPRASPHQRVCQSTSSKNGLELRSVRSGSGNASENGVARTLSPDSDQSDTPAPPSPTPSVQSSRYSDSGSEESSSSNRWLFQRAANLLRQSLDLDGAGGVMFMEADDNSSEYVAAGYSNSSEFTNPAPLLAMSTRIDPFSYQASSMLSDPAVNLDSVFLKQLTHRYPKGKLWSFHRDGTFSTSEDQLADESRKQRKKSKASETSKLNNFFPDASEVMFVPLWNATDSQWFAGCFCWTPQPTRVFSPAVDLSSVFAFGSSIMTEYSRVESVIADRQKGDFISSISHELRSPLHGVLAAAEFFGSTTLDQFQETLLNTINACGRTLLDTMNQVLDFSKIMSLERHKKAFKHGKDPWKLKPSEETMARMDALVLTDVALLTEDVIDSVCLGHSHMRKSALSTNHHTDASPTSPSKSGNSDSQVGLIPQVDVIVDIPDNDWMYKVQPGSLRRLVMNILGNALKYTRKGRISVCMEVTERSKDRSRRQGLEDTVTLTISDTGKGISKEYLRKHLFTPFSQEDPLSVGTGLGLSIVRGIVRTLNGKISIRSRQGKGTTVKVSLPLERLVGDGNPQPTSSMENPDFNKLAPSSQLQRVDCSGKRAAIWGIDPADIGKHPFWASIARYITDWYGLQLVPVSANESIDIIFMNERDLSANEMQNFPAALPGLLIFCSEASNQGDAKAQWSHLADSLAIIHRPCGPRKLSRGILSCLYAKLTSPTLNPQNLRQGLVLPERPVFTSLPLPVEGSNPSLSGNLRSPATEPRVSTRGSSTIDPTERSASALTWRTDSSAQTMSGSTDSTDAASSSSIRHSSSDSGQVSTSSGSESRPRVLVVDDNNINLHLMMTFMKKRKVMVLDKAMNGREAVEAFERMPQGYNLIFMDMSMPVMDGFEATRAIRAIEKERDGCIPAKIIALTGLSSSLDEARALDSGVDLFLTKPVSFREVSRLVHEWEAKPPK